MQTTVLVLTALIAVASSVLAAGLLVASNAPFDHGFSTQHGAQLTAQFDGSKVTAAQLAATAHTTGVTAAAGPYQVISASPRSAAASTFLPTDFALPSLTIGGRASAAPGVDDVTLTRGHWPTGPGQIVLASTTDLPQDLQRLEFAGSPGSPTLTVVGVATSVSQTADAWVTPAQLQALTPPGSTPRFEMLYRFAHAGTDAEVAADRAAIAAAVPHGALTGTQSWLAIKQLQAANAEAFVPFVIAFGVLGLALSVLIISIVVSGAVGSGDPAHRHPQVARLDPSPGRPRLRGAGADPSHGRRRARRRARQSARHPCPQRRRPSYGTAGLSVPMWVDVVVPAAAIAAVAVAATVPALRAARMRAAEAIAVGRTPRAGRGRRAQLLAARLPLARPIGLGLANPFARPARSVLTGATVLFGAVTITFASAWSCRSCSRATRTRLGRRRGHPHRWPVAAPRRRDQGSRTGQPARRAGRPAGGGRRHRRAAGNPQPLRHHGGAADRLRRRWVDAGHRLPGRFVLGHSPDGIRTLAHGPGEAVVTGRFLTAAGSTSATR